MTPADHLALALANGGVLTGKPDGSEPVTVLFTADAWQRYSKEIVSQLEGRPSYASNHPYHCRRCDHRYTPDGENLDCPSCGFDGKSDPHKTGVF